MPEGEPIRDIFATIGPHPEICFYEGRDGRPEHCPNNSQRTGKSADGMVCFRCVTDPKAAIDYTKAVPQDH